jgi:hypothetical protein
MHVAFTIPYVYDFITKLCRKQIEVMQNHYTVFARVFATLFLTRIYPPKLGYGLHTEYYALLTTEPAMPVLYVVKLPVETASV